MRVRQDISVAPNETPASPLEDSLKMKKSSGREIRNLQKDNETFQKQIRAQSISELAGKWGVSEESLRRLGTGFDKLAKFAYTFPMRNWRGEIVGIRKRSYKDIHSKYAVKDSRQGLFVPEGVTPGNLQIVNEGESDVAIALSVGFQAIGVPTAGGAIGDVVEFVSQSPVACPCIFGDNDSAGMCGAEKLADGLLEADIPCRVLIPPEPYSDLRDWSNRGNLTPEMLAETITEQKILYPDRWPSNFFIVPNALIRHGVILQVGPAAYTILTTIASFCDSKGVCRATREKLSELTGLDVRTIDRCKRILKAPGLLSWEPGHTGRANEYRVNLGPCKGSRCKYSVRSALGEKKK